MSALGRKLWRDLWQLRAQVASIALVLACGVGGFVSQFSTHASLREARDGYYRESRFADLFAAARRAPTVLGEQIAAIPGVQRIKLENVFDTRLELPGVREPVTARFIGLSLDQPAELNRLALRSGRLPQPGAMLEAVVNERFAEVRGLRPGSVVSAVLEGRLQQVAIVGTVIAPEYVFATRGGAPDDRWFGVMWVEDDRLASVYGMTGAFNRVSLELAQGMAREPVIAALESLLEPWGGLAPVGRDRQLSSAIVDNELRQLQVLGTVLPAIFLGVAVAVLASVMSRQVSAQRQAIATLKAIGYRDAAIAWHFLQFALAVTGVGVALGLAVSAVLGRATLALYAESFRFDALVYRVEPGAVMAAAAAAAVAAAAAALGAIRAIIALSPAQALQPPIPLRARRSLLERLLPGIRAPAAVMVVRHLSARPLRALLTIGGLAAAVALLIAGMVWRDTIDHLIDVQYRLAQRGDVMIEFSQPRPREVLESLRRLPGVLDAEVWRTEPARAAVGPREVDVVVSGLAPGARLMRTVDAQRRAVDAPPDGVIVNALLARELGLRPGDRLRIVFRQGERRSVEVPVREVVRTFFGRLVLMDETELHRLAGSGETVGHAIVAADATAAEALHAALRASPEIAAVSDKAASLASFEETTARNLGYFTAVLTGFAVAMAAGIAYNALRIALAERAWELASLRVLGMTRAEVSGLLLAEVGLLVLVALPLGCVAGWGLAAILMGLMASENIDFPVVIAPSTYAWAAGGVLIAAAASALAVRRRIDQLDLVAVLKVRP